MRLTELDAKLTDDGILKFDSPSCTRSGNPHAIRVALAPAKTAAGAAWHHTGKFPDTLTLEPSINAGCWHGYITNGEVR